VRLANSLILFFLLTLSFLQVSSSQENDWEQQLTEEEAALKRLNNVLDRMFKDKELSEDEYSRFKSLFKIIGQLQSDYNILYDDMVKALAGYDIERIIQKSTLTDKNKMSLAQDELISMKSILNEYENKYIQIANPDSLEKKVAGLHLSENITKSFWKGYKKSFYHGFSSTLELFRIEKEIVSEMYTLLQFLKLNFGNYYYKGDQIYFDSEQDIQVYNKHIRKLHSLADKQLKLERQILEQRKKFLDELRLK